MGKRARDVSRSPGVPRLREPSLEEAISVWRLSKGAMAKTIGQNLVKVREGTQRKGY